MSLCSLVAAALTACGGGDGSGSVVNAAAGALAVAAPTSVAAADAYIDGSGTQLAATDAPDVSALAVKASSEKVVTIAAENQNFLVAGTMLVRYGAGNAWVTRQVTDKGSCTNDYFRRDPARGSAKSCVVVVKLASDAAPVVATAALPTAEGGTFYVFGTANVRYGAKDKWMTKSVTGRATCSNEFFGNDPLYLTVKACQLVTASGAPLATVSDTVAATAAAAASTTVAATVPAPVTAAAPAPVTAPATAAATATATTAVAVAPQVSAVATSVAAAPATVVAAASTPTAATPPAASAPPAAAPVVASLMPFVDVAKIPAAVAGFSTPRLWAANTADPGQNPAPSDGGAVREYCEFSHMSYDDPIVSPGKPGAHLHTFMGNTGIDRNSTADSVAKSGNSTCAGGTANRTAYWIPSIIDTRDGSPVKPVGSLMYYKSGYEGVTGPSIRPFPAGLRMVSGNPNATSSQGANAFTCAKPDGTWNQGPSIPADCPAGSRLTVGVLFPQCWDGVNLDSPDHRSHMSHTVGGKCPATHPVPLTGITIQMNFPVPDSAATANWRLSSDNYDKSLPGGYSVHADWFDGWDPEVLSIWTTRCMNANMDCHAFLIGDGRYLGF